MVACPIVSFHLAIVLSVFDLLIQITTLVSSNSILVLNVVAY